MDTSGSGPHHKRSFTEMTSGVISSPPSHQFALHNSRPLSQLRPVTSSFDRRRPQAAHRASEMSERFSPPRLEHRASQTIIDLTDDTEEATFATHGAGRRGPPLLSRSDAQNIVGLIDLTDDNGEPEIQITHSRARGPREPRRRATATRRDNEVNSPRQRHPESPSLFVPEAPAGPHQNRQNFNLLQVGLGRLGAAFDLFLPDHIEEQYQQHIMNHHQAMPQGLNYQNQAFENAPAPAPAYVPPPPAKEGFTRSPKEDDVIICPSCEQELVYDPDQQNAIVTKHGKTPTKKDREEHPFWVLKECGHVFCNACYQNRAKLDIVGFEKFPAVDGKVAKKGIKCAVPDCNSDVKAKEKWVGVFI